MKKQLVQSITQHFIKTVPFNSLEATKRNIKLAELEQAPDYHLELIHGYMQRLEEHKAFLEFFEIGVVKDPKSKIENVAKYVGLALTNNPLDVFDKGK